ncbi:MAG: hypothetical protein R8F63_04735 [Acidimicrobiales bacterium]|nr:hypothetical protein [Acidimicrobiales bacterium]
MQQEFAGQVDIIGVAGASDSVPHMEEFISTTGVGGFPHVQDLGNDVWARYEIRTQPRFAFIDDDGSVEITAALGESGLRERIAALAATDADAA